MISLGLGTCAAVVAVALGHLIYTGYVYSRQFDNGKWTGYAPGVVEQGWFFWRRVDLSDTQWREFRSAAPSLAVVLVLFAVISRWMQRRWAKAVPVQPEAAARARARFIVGFAALFMGYLHGYTAIYVFALVAANWALAQSVAGTRFGAWIIWGANLAALLTARLTDGFPISMLLGPNFDWIDRHRGVMRWHICYNLTVLRMLSFALDLHWHRLAEKKDKAPSKCILSSKNSINASAGKDDNGSIKHRTSEDGESEDLPLKIVLESSSSNVPTTAKGRQTTALPLPSDYSLLYSLAHALYPPLYLAGPIITFQDFAWQIKATGTTSTKVPSSAGIAADANANTEKSNKEGLDTPLSPGLSSSPVSSRSTLSIARNYVKRLAADIICIEVLTHTMYFNSLAVHKIGKRYALYGLQYGPSEVGLTAWWVISFMWLKFTVMWRTFRLGALLEGIDPPENMMRCFANNYDIEGFWKGWHSSYNRWLVRYMYVPMGGSHRRVLSIWPIFLFVAIWHDLEWRLLSWAWLICAAFLPELAVKRIAAAKRFDKSRSKLWFRAVSAALAAVNCAGLMAANMVGFVVGPDGMSDLFRQLFDSPKYVAAVLISFYCAMHLNFAWREREALKSAKAAAKE